MQAEPEPEPEADAEAWRAHCRNVVAMVEGTVVGETAPEEPVMAGEVVRVEAEAEAEPVVAGDVVADVMEREAPTAGGAGEAVGSLEFIGLWKENNKKHKRLMPIKIDGGIWYGSESSDDYDLKVRVALGRLVDKLVRNKAPSGLLAISNWTQKVSTRTGEGNRERRVITTEQFWGISWSASADDERYQQLGLISMQAPLGDIRFAGFDGVIGPGGSWGIAVYRVTLPRGGLDRSKWAGRPPPLAPEDLYTGPRSDGLLSTGEISGEYSAACRCVGEFPMICNSMTVVPLGADMIEIHSSGCAFFPPLLLCGPGGGGKVKTRQPGTNVFGEGVREWYAVGRSVGEMRRDMTFLADGTAKSEEECCGFKKRPTSQKRSFQKVETRDLAGTWCGCSCLPFVPLWPILLMEGDLLSCTTKKVLNEDQYAESGCRSILCLPIPVCDTRTRLYMHGHVTNGFAKDGGIDWWCCTLLQHLLCIRHARKCGGGDFDDFDWYHDPSYTRKKKELVGISFFAKKIG
jgi:hypothetical protein